MNKTNIKIFPFTDNTNIKDIRKDIKDNPQAFVKKMLTGSKFNFGVSNITNYGIYREAGFYYDLKPILKHYVYRKFDHWEDIYALNKANVRKIVGRCDHLTELTK